MPTTTTAGSTPTAGPCRRPRPSWTLTSSRYADLVAITAPPAAPTVTLTIDGREVTAPEGATIWEAAKEAGIEIPVLCHDERYDPVGVCRMCVVDVGARVYAAACVRPCEDGMEVKTATPALERNRAQLTELLLVDQPPVAEDPKDESSCVTCGECVAACPTGAIVNKPINGVPIRPRSELRQVETVCPYCGVGCALTFNVDDERKAIAYADGREQPGSKRRLCVKGRYGWDYTFSKQRLTTPLIRRESSYPKGPLSSDVRGNERRRRRKPGGLVDYEEVMPHFRDATWEEALDLVASRLKAIHAESGPKAIAGFGSAKCSNEEAYLFQKLIRAGFGTNNVDHCTRLCHASSVAALFE